MKSNIFDLWIPKILVLLLIPGVVPLFGQTEVEPGFNLFSVEQDIEIGRQSAAEVEKQLPVLKDDRVQDYVQRIGQRLESAAPGPDYPYQFKVLNLSDVNAFALPGGFMYVNRGLIEAVESEGELAGVLAHEMAHVALRHGTNQASKAYLAQAGLGILGGLLGGGGGATGQIVQAIGGFGLNAVFLKFSRSAEEQADIVGAQMLDGAGYNPLAMADFFETLREHAGRDPGKVEEFFSSHPAPQNRAERIREEARQLGPPRRSRFVADIDDIQSRLDRMPQAPSMQNLAGNQPSAGGGTLERASSDYSTFENRTGFFSLSYPQNWRPYESDRSLGVTIVPNGGVTETSQGQQQIIYGVIVNHYEPFEGTTGGRFGREEGPFRGRTELERASNELLGEILQSNQYLRVVSGSQRRERLDRGSALSVMLTGRSQATGEEERVTMFTRGLPDGHILYILFIAPASRYQEASGVFNKMISSLEVNEWVHQ